jgi:hypothetical protein
MPSRTPNVMASCANALARSEALPGTPGEVRQP